jgi:micrococcal nuclease
LSDDSGVRVARRRFRRSPYRALAVLVVLAALAAARYFLGGPLPPNPAQPLAEGSYAVLRVVDGDTLVVAPEAVVRLIGVDTPETVRPEHPVEPWGPEAAEFTRAFVAGGSVRLSFDRERFDRYGRHLAYVWVGERMLNEELLRAGLARWEPQFRYAEPIKRRFREAQKEAQRAQMGIWSQNNFSADN